MVSASSSSHFGVQRSFYKAKAIPKSTIKYPAYVGDIEKKKILAWKGSRKSRGGILATTGAWTP
jgi:hypothetical protein